jgi:hypothetical protein
MPSLPADESLIRSFPAVENPSEAAPGLNIPSLIFISSNPITGSAALPYPELTTLFTKTLPVVVIFPAPASKLLTFAAPLVKEPALLIFPPEFKLATVVAPADKVPVVLIAPEPAAKLATVVAPADKVFVIAALPADKAPVVLIAPDPASKLPADKAPVVVIAPDPAFKLVTVVAPADNVLVILAVPFTSRVVNGS